MLLIARKEDGKILAKWDAWDVNCEDNASQYITENSLNVVDDEITFSGNRILWVE